MPLNKKIIRSNFSRAASSYETAAQVQKYSAKKLCELITPEIKSNLQVLDLGSGTGFVAHHLPKNLQIFECDISLQMLTQNTFATHKLQCDFEDLPFKDRSFDILISSFSLQWLEDFEKNFAQFFKILKSHGIFAFCLPTNESLKELKVASEASKCNFHFNNLPKISEVKSALKKCGFEEKLFKSEIVKSEFETGLKALKSIRESGANYSEKINFTSKAKLANFNNFCLKNSAGQNKNFILSWNVSFFIFQKSH